MDILGAVTKLPRSCAGTESGWPVLTVPGALQGTVGNLGPTIQPPRGRPTIDSREGPWSRRATALGDYSADRLTVGIRTLGTGHLGVVVSFGPRFRTSHTIP